MLQKIKFNKSLNFSNFKEVNNYIIIIPKTKNPLLSSIRALRYSMNNSLTSSSFYSE